MSKRLDRNARSGGASVERLTHPTGDLASSAHGGNPLGEPFQATIECARSGGASVERLTHPSEALASSALAGNPLGEPFQAPPPLASPTAFGAPAGAGESDGFAVVASRVAGTPILQCTRSRVAMELGLMLAMWQRDMLRLRRDPARWIGVVVQPLLFWLLLGTGMGSVFTIAGLGGLDYLQFFFPGLLVMVVLFTTIFAMMAVIEDRQHGFLQQVMAAPGSRAGLVLGKTAGVATVALVQVLLTLVAAPLAGFDLAAVHWPLLATVFLAGTVGLTALSFALAWVLRSTAGYHAIMAVFLLPLWLVSGAMFPPTGGWLDAVMTVNPMTYMVDGFRHALHGGLAPVSLHGPTTTALVLLAFAVVAVLVAVTIARRVPGATR